LACSPSLNRIGDHARKYSSISRPQYHSERVEGDLVSLEDHGHNSCLDGNHEEDLVAASGEALSPSPANNGPAPSTSYNIFEGVLAAEYDKLLHQRGAGGDLWDDTNGENGARCDKLAEILGRFNLTVDEQLVIKIGPLLSVHDADSLFSRFRSYGSCRWATIADMNKWLDSLPVLGQKWVDKQLLTLEVAGREHVYTARYTEDITSVLQSIVWKDGIISGHSAIYTARQELLRGRVDMSQRILGVHVSE